MVFACIKKQRLLFPCLANCSTFLPEIWCETAEYYNHQRTIKYLHPETQPYDMLHAINCAMALRQMVLNRKLAFCFNEKQCGVVSETDSLTEICVLRRRPANCNLLLRVLYIKKTLKLAVFVCLRVMIPSAFPLALRVFACNRELQLHYTKTYCATPYLQRPAQAKAATQCRATST